MNDDIRSRHARRVPRGRPKGQGIHPQTIDFQVPERQAVVQLHKELNVKRKTPYRVLVIDALVQTYPGFKGNLKQKQEAYARNQKHKEEASIHPDAGKVAKEFPG